MAEENAKSNDKVMPTKGEQEDEPENEQEIASEEELESDSESESDQGLKELLLAAEVKEEMPDYERTLKAVYNAQLEQSDMEFEIEDGSMEIASAERAGKVVKDALMFILNSYDAEAAAKFANLEGVKRFEFVQYLKPGGRLPAVILRSENSVVFGFVQAVENQVEWDPFARFRIDERSNWIFHTHITVAAQKQVHGGIWGWLDASLRSIVPDSEGPPMTGHVGIEGALLGLQNLLMSKIWKMTEWEKDRPGSRITVATSDSVRGGTWAGERSALPARGK